MATRQYASSYTGADTTFKRSYVSTTAPVLNIAYSDTFESTFSGYSRQYHSVTSATPHQWLKVYAGETPYLKAYIKSYLGTIQAPNYTRGWMGTAEYVAGANYMAQHPLSFHKGYSADYTKVYTDSAGASYTKIWVGTWEKAYNSRYYTGATGSYLGGANFNGYIEPWASGAYSGAGGAYGIGLVDYVAVYARAESFEGAAGYVGVVAWSKNWTKIWQSEVDFVGTRDFQKDYVATFEKDYTKVWSKEWEKDYGDTYTKVWSKVWSKDYTVTYSKGYDGSASY